MPGREQRRQRPEPRVRGDLGLRQPDHLGLGQVPELGNEAGRDEQPPCERVRLGLERAQDAPAVAVVIDLALDRPDVPRRQQVPALVGDVEADAGLWPVVVEDDHGPVPAAQEVVDDRVELGRALQEQPADVRVLGEKPVDGNGRAEV